ncbi:hypothetical protein NMY22_g16455 [Coprinellus aureogranulatus]|nr:hypothetical protein NMY22_g16455 [Coprinellus aureogranulatus]
MPHGLMNTFAHQCAHWLGHQMNHKAQHWVNDQVTEYQSEGASSARAFMDDPTIIDIIDFNVSYDRKGGWSSSFSSWTTCDDNCLVVIRSTFAGIRVSRIQGAEVPFIRELMRSGGKRQTASSWVYSTPQGPIHEHLDHFLTPYSQRSYFSFGKPANHSYKAASLLIGMSWLKWRFDAEFERVVGKYPVQYRFEGWHGDGGVTHEAPWVGPRGTPEYRDITVRYWSFKDATICLACESLFTGY